MSPKTLTWNGRLPGVAVQSAAPQQSRDSFRLDVAGFVGFAERGPLDTPVMVEDIGQYRAVFGGDVFLARSSGLPVYAQLPRAVQAFFDNGGRRCYVVRVAGDKARANRFRLSGLMAWSAEQDLQQVICPAGSVGHWSDKVRVATQLHRQPLFPDRPWRKDEITIEPFPLPDPKNKDQETKGLVIKVLARVPKATAIQRGDLLCARFKDPSGLQVFFPVARVDQDSGGTNEYTVTRTIRLQLQNEMERTVSFATRRMLPPLKGLGAVDYQVAVENAAGCKPEEWCSIPARRIRRVDEPNMTMGEPRYQIHVSNHSEFFTGTEDTTAKFPNRLRLTYISGEVYEFVVGDIAEGNILLCPQVMLDAHSLDGVDLLTESGWSSKPLPRPSSSLRYIPDNDSLDDMTDEDNLPYRLEFPLIDHVFAVDDVLRLRYKNGRQYLLFVRNVSIEFRDSDGGSPVVVVEALQVWEELPAAKVDLENLNFKLTNLDLLTFDLYIRESREYLESWRGLRFNQVEQGTQPQASYWEDVLARPINGAETSTTTDELLKRSTRLARLEQDNENNKLLFLPLNMREQIVTRERFQGRSVNDTGADDGLKRFNPVKLFLDEEFLSSRTDDSPVFEDNGNSLKRDDGLLPPDKVRAKANDLLYLQFPPRQPKRLKKLHSLFAVEEVALIAIPDLTQRSWGCRSVRDIIDPERAIRRDYSKFAPCLSLQPRRKINWYARLQRYTSVIEEQSEMDVVQVLAKLTDVDADWQPCDSMDELLMVHRAMINLAAARQDVIAILSLPESFGYLDALDWQQQLVEGVPNRQNVSQAVQDQSSESTLVQYIEGGYNDAETLSYAAAYYGWVQVREEHTPQLLPTRMLPPDGTVCGMIAARERQRGPGVAPANTALRGVVGLKPLVNDSQWEDLFNCQINVLHARPGKFLTLSAYTLCTEQTFLQLSVRRMVIFLRKLVLHEGYHFVFESNNERLRRSLQIRYERIFNRLLQGGSLMAYEVNTGTDLNTQQEVDAGRLIISIRFALTYPIEYITITLLRTGESLLEVRGG